MSEIKKKKIKRPREIDDEHTSPKQKKIKVINSLEDNKNLKKVKKNKLKINEGDENVKKTKVKKNTKEKKNTNKESENIPEVTQQKRKKKKKKSHNKFAIQDDAISSTTSDDNIKKTNNEQPSNKKNKTTDKKQHSFNSLWENYKKRSTPFVSNKENWYLQLITENDSIDSTTTEVKQKLFQLATQVMKDDTDAVNQISSKRKDFGFQMKVLNQGTSRDKMAAHMLRCMEDPIHSLHNLRTLVDMVSPKSKGGFIEVMNSLKELLDTSLLTNENCIAKKFDQHNFSVLLPLVITSPEQALQQLVLWYFGDQLRNLYLKIVNQLSFIAKDTVEKNKQAAIRNLLDLLQSHPHQEEELILQILVNKLGDPSRKVAAQTMYGLRTLLMKRPHLKTRVVNLSQELLFRSNISEKARFYTLCFLKDMIFTNDDYKLVEKLINIYFGFFKACTKKGEVDTRLMGALLRGINRAYPYLSSEGNKVLDEHIETLYKLVHLVNFSIATQALQLIYQVLGQREDQVSDRFYQTVYRKIQDPSFGGSSACSAFLNLVFKTMCRDESIKRIQAFIKRLLQTCYYIEPSVICGILYLISEIMKEKPGLKDVKELMLNTNINNMDDDSDTEFYPDLDVDEAGNILQPKKVDERRENEEQEDDKSKLFKEKGSWVHRQNHKSSGYDPYDRNPLYCGAETSIFWELERIVSHFHPSVKSFASQLLTGKLIQYNGDPLLDFEFTKFLDRFVYKNPKKAITKNDNAGGKVLGRKNAYVPQGIKKYAVNSEEFINLKEEKVPEDELFFHRYFTKFQIEKPKVKEEDVSDNESIADDEFDKFLYGGAGADDDLDLDFASSFSVPKDDDDDDEDDFMEEDSGDENQDTTQSSPKKKKSKKQMKNENDSEDDLDAEDFEGDLDGEDSDAAFGSLSGDSGDDDFNEEAFAFSDSEDEGVKPNKSKKGKPEKLITKKSKGKKSIQDNFADADEFAHLLEENSDANNLAITSDAVYNQDKSSVKQLKWEAERDRFMKNKSWRNKPKGRFNQSNRGGNKKFKRR